MGRHQAELRCACPEVLLSERLHFLEKVAAKYIVFLGGDALGESFSRLAYGYACYQASLAMAALPSSAGVTYVSCHPGWADTPGVDSSIPTFKKMVGDAQAGKRRRLGLCIVGALLQSHAAGLWSSQMVTCDWHSWTGRATAVEEAPRMRVAIFYSKTAVSCHPSPVVTPPPTKPSNPGGWVGSGWWECEGWVRGPAIPALPAEFRTTWQGAEGIVWLCVAPRGQLRSGEFYLDRAVAPKHLPKLKTAEGDTKAAVLVERLGCPCFFGGGTWLCVHPCPHQGY